MKVCLIRKIAILIQLTVTGDSTCCTFDSWIRISLALLQRALTSDSLIYSHFLSWSIHWLISKLYGFVVIFSTLYIIFNILLII